MKASGIEPLRPSWPIATMTRCSESRFAGSESGVQSRETCCGSYRPFFCGLCRDSVVVCRCCDHGQRYCVDSNCGGRARQRLLRRYRRDYQLTRRGRSRHAARQARYRLRLTQKRQPPDEKVTDHPSPTAFGPDKVFGNEPSPQDDVDEAAPAPAPTPAPDPELQRCAVCHRLCGPFQHRWDDW